MVTHGNIIHNQQVIQLATGNTKNSIYVSWLPLFHDMGLINALQSCFVGIPYIMMPPTAFLQKPIRWLKAISKYRATITGGPSFAYDLCVRKIKSEDLEEIDLSTLEVVANGAEPVKAETLTEFTHKFSSCGFRQEAFYPCYGMAEATLFITGGNKNQKPVIQEILADELEKNFIVESEISSKKSRVLVGCGRPYLNTTVIIVNPESLTRCEKEQVGEIWISGASVASGYWNRSSATQETFQAYLQDIKEGPFLRTGDLGFFKNEELFVAGRLKDLIIIRGRNYYPQDIELTVENSHPSLLNNCSAAFSVEVEEEERLIVACEVERTYLRKLNVEEVVREIQIAISTEHELEVHGVVLLKTGTIPKTSSGKIQRHVCKLGFLEGSLNTVGQWQKNIEKNQTIISDDLQVNKTSQTVAEIEVWLTNKIAEILELSAEKINLKEPLAIYGLDSVKAVNIAAELEEWLGIPVNPTVVYDYPNIESLANYFGEKNNLQKQANSISNSQLATNRIAIIGIGCRFPEANNPEAFWSLLKLGKNAVSKVPVSRWQSDCEWGGFLDQIDRFDAQFFNISAREAINMDPQQRLLLEISWEALENAGLASDRLVGSRGGVFIGISNGDYAKLKENIVNTDPYYGTGNAFSIAANRLSYILDWRGPSWSVDTACSSSLVAVHQACQSLLVGECNIALAGGVNLMLTPQLTRTFSQANMIASDGLCKTFDVDADGYVRGEGCGIIVLKRLDDAIADGDNIQAVIRGSAVNQDGLTNGLTAPNGNSQQEVIRLALEKAGVKPNQISYVETHGTGTTLGDPIEVNSLKTVLMEDRLQQQTCWIGSVKTNIGHLEASAGIAGLIKVILSLQHQQIPPHLHFNKLNPYIKIDNTSLKIPTELQPWHTEEKTRIAGVSSFGFGGTNVHVILEEAEGSPQESVLRSQESGSSRKGNNSQSTINNQQLTIYNLQSTIQNPKSYLLNLSAKNEQALKDLVEKYQHWLVENNNNNVDLKDICFTANTGRSPFNHRLAIITNNQQDLTDKLTQIINQEEPSGVFLGEINNNTQLPKIAFLFTGQGSQYINMGRQLYETNPIFRQTFNQCQQILESYLEISLLDVLYPQENQQFNQSLINETAYTQPALFALEYALFKVWESWGVKPDLVMGHSVGEYVAATVSRVFSLEDGLKLIAYRGRLMQKLPPGGAMVSVMATEEKINELIVRYGEKVSLAAINGPESIVISGELATIQDIVSILESEAIKTTPLQVSHAFHSPLMKPMLAEFEAIASQIHYNQPQIPIISNVTGTEIGDRISRANYWLNHICQPVRFAQGINNLKNLGCEVFLEIGSKPILLTMGRECLLGTKKIWLPSIRPNKDNYLQMLESLAQLYLLGYQINWSGFYQNQIVKKVILPTYPWQRKRYWITDLRLREQGTGNREQGIVLVNSETKLSQLSLNFQISNPEELDGTNKTKILNFSKRKLLKLDSVSLPSSSNLEPKAKIKLTELNKQFIASQSSESVPRSNDSKVIDNQAQNTNLEFNKVEIDVSKIREEIKQLLAEALYVDINEIEPNQKFIDLGLDSIIGVEWINSINQTYQVNIKATKLYDYPTFIEFTEYVIEEISRITEKIIPQQNNLELNQSLDFLQKSGTGNRQQAIVDNNLQKQYQKNSKDLLKMDNLSNDELENIKKQLRLILEQVQNKKLTIQTANQMIKQLEQNMNKKTIGDVDNFPEENQEICR
jgi:malonyl CoA-acyl carrier protein transacylase